MRLKRARLADNLNEKIAQRPGPMELVEKNILPVDSTLKQAIIGEISHHTTWPAGATPPQEGRFDGTCGQCDSLRREVVVRSVGC